MSRKDDMTPQARKCQSFVTPNGVSRQSTSVPSPLRGIPAANPRSLSDQRSSATGSHCVPQGPPGKCRSAGVYAPVDSRSDWFHARSVRDGCRSFVCEDPVHVRSVRNVEPDGPLDLKCGESCGVQNLESKPVGRWVRPRGRQESEELSGTLSGRRQLGGGSRRCGREERDWA